MAPNGPLDEATSAKVRRQVEFYFSDSNAPRDRFLLEKMNIHPEGYVELAVICSFSRMSRILNIAVNQKPEEIPNVIIKRVAAALTASTELVVSKDGLAVRRKLPLKPQTEAVHEMDERTIFAAPLPFDCTLEVLTEFFNNVAPVRAVRMRRRTATKDFRGSVFVEFHSKAVAEEVVKQVLSYEGAQLRLEMKNAYMARIIEERKRKAQAASHAEGNSEEPANADNGGGGADGTHSGAANGAADSDGPAAGPSSSVQHAANGSGEPRPVSYEKGLVLRFTIPEEVELPSDMHYNLVKESFGGRANGIAFAEYHMGQRTGFVRVHNKERTMTVLEMLDENGTIAIGTIRANVEVLDGDEELDFHTRAFANRTAAEQHKRPGGGEFFVSRKRPGNIHGRGGRGGPGRFGKRGRMF